jgi:leucine dehydrogenase
MKGRVGAFYIVAIGLEAVLVVDSLALGPGVGGVRTRPYSNLNALIQDARALAKAMTIKCALAGLDAGGAKIVVNEVPLRHREKAFARLGELVCDFGGLVHTGADLGTTAEDINRMASCCEFVHLRDGDLSEAAGRGLLRGVEACAQFKGVEVADLSVAIQGAGMIGRAAAKALASAGAKVVIADLDEALALEVAEEVGGTVCAARDVLGLDVDILCPCAVGGIITADVVDGMKAWALCGAANNIVADTTAHARLQKRGILHVPDVVASAGAVAYGISKDVMGAAEPFEFVDGLGATALALLTAADQSGRLPAELAEARAMSRVRGQ